MTTSATKNTKDNNKENDDGKRKKGQKSISSFFPCKEKNAQELEATKTIDDNNNNIMGLDSNLRKSAIRKAKEHGNGKKRNPQRTIDGGEAEGRCDEGTKVCAACSFNEKHKSEGKKARFAHDITCKLNTNYKYTNGGRISMMDYYLAKYEEERDKMIRRPFSASELHTGGNAQEDIDTFFAPPNPVDSASNGKLQVQEKKKPVDLTVSDILSSYETSNLTARIHHYMKNRTYVMRKGESVPMVVSAAIQALLDLVPDTFKKGTNMLKAKDRNSVTYKKLQAYRRHFPPGTLGFTFPKADKTQPPDVYYNQVEGRTIYLVCWELNIPDFQPRCFECGGTLIHDQYDYKQHGYATPIFNVSGSTDYSVSMMYNCSLCKNRCKANDGRVLASIEVPFRNGYPVDPRYAVKKQTHLSKTFTSIMDKLFITHGNGDQLAIMLHELRGDKYLDLEEEYFCQAIASGTSVLKSLPSFEDFIGRYSPTGWDLRELKNFAADSHLHSTGVSDRQRFRREIQSVGCDKNSASDHTFAFTSNYNALPDKACGHTIGNNYGEIASIAIVKDTKQTSYAHQAEQCTLRPNWKPKVHTTDNCPAGIALWKKLNTGIRCQLGLFHYTYRITKTLNKECKLWRDALSELQTCIYYYEQDDVEKVKRCLRNGTLGTVDGNKVKPSDIERKARSYREYIRIWTYSEENIQDNLIQWYKLHENTRDEQSERLFTNETEKTVREQANKAKWVVDTLSKDELYLQVEAGSMSTTGLTMFIGARGSESKLEKGHHAIAHFANTGMRHTLADFLGLGGIALHNLRIRYRLKIAKMAPSDRAKIPVGFHRSPPFTNHLRLSHNNALGRKAGLTVDVHQPKDVEILQPDNGEKFLYEYYKEQQAREKAGIGNDDNINRCLCQACGKVDNPYRRRKKQWKSQDDAVAATTTPTPVPPPPAPVPLMPLIPLPPALQVLPPRQVRSVTLSRVGASSVGAYSQIMRNERINNKRKPQ